MKTVTVFDAVQRLRAAALKAGKEHSKAMAAGGYVNPYENVAEVQITDVIPITKATWSVNLDLAADLLELHDRTSLNIAGWPAARRFVEDALAAEGITTPIVGDH